MRYTKVCMETSKEALNAFARTADVMITLCHERHALISVVIPSGREMNEHVRRSGHVHVRR